MGGNEEVRTRLVLVVPSDSTRGNGHAWKYVKFHLNMKRHFTVRVTEHWNRLPREGCEVSVCGDA